MSPFLANLMVGAILALVGWAIAFGVYVLKQDRAREREIAALKLELANMRADFVTQSAWTEFNRAWSNWRDNLTDKIQHISESLAALTGKPLN